MCLSQSICLCMAGEDHLLMLQLWGTASGGAARCMGPAAGRSGVARRAVGAPAAAVAAGSARAGARRDVASCQCHQRRRRGARCAPRGRSQHDEPPGTTPRLASRPSAPEPTQPGGGPKWRAGRVAREGCGVLSDERRGCVDVAWRGAGAAVTQWVRQERIRALLDAESARLFDPDAAVLGADLPPQLGPLGAGTVSLVRSDPER